MEPETPVIERKSTSNHTENGEPPVVEAKVESAEETKPEEKEEKNSGEGDQCRHSKR